MSRHRAPARVTFVPVRGGVFPAATLLVLALGLTGDVASAHDGVAEQVAALTAQIAQQPRNPDLLLRRAELYRMDREWTAALDDLDRAGRLAAPVAAMQLVRARVFADRSEWRPAEQAATSVLRGEPRHLEALLIRARARRQLHDTRGAVDDFTAALGVRPQPDVYLERAHALLEAQRPDIDAALRGIDEGIARLGPVVTLELEAIELELRLARYDAAVARVDRVSAQAARKESWLARRGAILERAGRLEDARASYRAALRAAQSGSGRRAQSRASLALVQQLSSSLARLDARAIPADTTR